MSGKSDPLEGYWNTNQLMEATKRSRTFVTDCLQGKGKMALKGIRIGTRQEWYVEDAVAREFIRRVEQEDRRKSPAQLAKAVGKSRKYILDAITGYGGTREPRLRAVKEKQGWVIEEADAEEFIRKEKGTSSTDTE
jgi:hypothetical protein